MTKFITGVAFAILLGSLLTVTMTRALSQQAGWNVVMFGVSWSQNLTLAQAAASRTWMVDVNTGIREPLPFRYQDGIDGGISEDQIRILGSRPRLTTAGGGSDLVMFYRNPDGKQRLLTDVPSYNAEPEAVDDLHRIVFISDRDGSFDVYILLLDEEHNPASLQRLTTDNDVEREPEWLTREQYQKYLDQHHAGAIYIIIDEEALDAIRRGTFTTPTPP